MTTTAGSTRPPYCDFEALHERIESFGDWEATTAIYASEHAVQSVTQNGFVGSVVVSLAAAETTAYCRRVQTDDDDTTTAYFRYFATAVAPQIRLSFHYEFGAAHHHESDDNHPTDEYDDDDYATRPPTRVTVEWVHYPSPAWVDTEKAPLTAWLAQRAQAVLEEEGLSFAVCEFFEHAALTEYHYPVLDEKPPYKLLLLPPRMDAMYDDNPGIKIHPQQLAWQQQQQHPASNNNNNNHQSGRRNKSASSSASQPSNDHNKDDKDNRASTDPPVLKYARRALIEAWPQLYRTQCPICLDDAVPYADGIVTPACHHFVCRTCWDQYLFFQVRDNLPQLRQNPFPCPACGDELPFASFVQKYVSPEQATAYRAWKRDLDFPPCYSLTQCLDLAKCGGQDCMRYINNDLGTNLVFCDQCDKKWCELCLKRVRGSADHRAACDSATTLKFCRRYWKANDDIKLKCQERFPWIASYAVWRQNDGGALEWILEHGQQCPTCRTGVERTDGCFHMKCTQCATHFCYECGAEIFPPYYGTHHCWEDLVLEET